MLLTGLAEGADTLCAEVAAELGIPYTAVLPMPREEFVKDFEGEALEKFLSLLGRAENVLIAPETEEYFQGSYRDYLYRQVGIYMVEHSHLLLALWDGGEISPGGCGAAEIADVLQSGTYLPKDAIALRDLSNELLVHIVSPRCGSAADNAGEVRRIGNEKMFRTILKETDEFNWLSSSCSASGASLFPEGENLDVPLRALEKLYQDADRLSLRASERYRRILAVLAVLSTMIAAAFLLYDEVDLLWMILVCGAVLAIAWFCRRYAVRSDCHRQYIEYRQLAECLRVQAYLRYAGSQLDVKDLYPYSQQGSMPWIFAAICTLSVCPPPESTHSILSRWINGQLEYHEKAQLKTAAQLKRNNRIVKLAAIVAVSLYVAALCFELRFGGLILPPVLSPDIALWRLLIRLLLGLSSVATVFISNYYGKLSLTLKLSSHEKMHLFYSKMAVHPLLHRQSDELLAVLGREELVENLNWCAYQSDNAPTFNV